MTILKRKYIEVERSYIGIGQEGWIMSFSR